MAERLKMTTKTQHWDLIVLAGGIVGCATAFYAARAGMSCLIVERDGIASAQSGRNLGFVRQQGRDFRELSLMIGAMDLWPDLASDLGRDVGFRRSGYVTLAMCEADIPPSRERPYPESVRADQAHAEFRRLFPSLADAAIDTAWAGYIDTLPDVVPAIGPVAGIGGLLVATGFSGHGFGPGPMAGKVMAALADGRPAGVDLSGLSPDRFRSSPQP